MPNLRYELHHKICNLRYGNSYPELTDFTDLNHCMLHSLG